MFKVTLKSFVAIFLVVITACNEPADEHTKEDTLKMADAASEARIDSAYKAINRICDSLTQFKVPVMADSLLKNDSLNLAIYFDTAQFTSDDKKAETIIRQLQADCDSNLQKETYKRYQQLRLLKVKRPIKRKV
jgi:hypothetical protein